MAQTPEDVLTLSQTQSVSEQTPAGPIPNPPVYTQDQINQNLAGQTAANPLGIVNDDEGNPLPPTAAGRIGVGAPNDDSGVKTVSSINAGLNTASNSPIPSQPNVLDQYASYTYSLSLYLITDNQFNDLKSGPPNFSTWTLLMQSGGAMSTPGSTALGQRSPFFNLDYYLDNLNLTSKLPGGGGATLAAHNVTEIDFTILEPNGISLINNLAQAVQTLYKQAPASTNSTTGATTTVPGQAGAGPTTTGGGSTTPNYMAATYVMAIRFYGYDNQGNMLQAANPGGAIVTKYYPFAIAGLDFKLASKAIEYKVRGVIKSYTLSASAKRGSIPANFNLVGKTISDILNGNQSTGMQVSPDDGRTSTPSVQKAPPGPAQPRPDIQSTFGISGIHADTPGAANQQQADTLNLLVAGNMGA